MTEIASQIGRSTSTVSRELRRNMLEHDKGVYDADMAHHRSRERACRPSRPKLQTDAELRAEVQASSISNGARNRSPPTCAFCGRTGLTGTYATRPSTGPSIKAPRTL